jgi:hypothetical protein
MSDEITFENTANRTEVTEWYSITGAPAMDHPFNKTRKLMPISARFTFVDGDPFSLEINAKLVLRSGDLAKDHQKVPGIYIWDRGTWPSWMDELWELACSDFAASQKR